MNWANYRNKSQLLRFLNFTLYASLDERTELWHELAWVSCTVRIYVVWNVGGSVSYMFGTGVSHHRYVCYGFETFLLYLIWQYLKDLAKFCVSKLKMVLFNFGISSVHLQMEHWKYIGCCQIVGKFWLSLSISARLPVFFRHLTTIHNSQACTPREETYLNINILVHESWSLINHSSVDSSVDTWWVMEWVG